MAEKLKKLRIVKKNQNTSFINQSEVELNRYIMLGPENDKQKVLFI
jgi:hypothetical protein